MKRFRAMGTFCAYYLDMNQPAPVWDRESLKSPHDAADKAGRVRRMFDVIAPTYELINTLFSAGRDGAWRRRLVRMARVASDDEVLDVACGTGDLARAFAGANPRMVVGVDFSHQMLKEAYGRDDGKLLWCEGDALHLPFANSSFSVASCAFGVRNFQDLKRGFGEFARILKPGGRLLILEFARPSGRVRRFLYELYTRRIMPLLATVISRDRAGAYRYLPQSVVSFPSTAEVSDQLSEVGFTNVTCTPLTLGAVVIYTALSPES